MKQKIISGIVYFTIAFYGCQFKSMTAKSDHPISDLGHIDLILDSVTWHNIKTDTFLQKEFGVMESDTIEYGGKPSYDLYILGQRNFLHLSLAKGFWNNQQGGGVLVFQTQRPGQYEALLQSWKEYYKDSLYVHHFTGSDFTLDEIMTWHKRDSIHPKEPSVFANLTSYSDAAYKNWGISDSLVLAGDAMKQFMASWGGAPLQSRLFQAISQLNMDLNKNEFEEIKSALLAVGYTENNNHFTHPHNPAIYIKISEEKGKPKYSTVQFRLSRPTSPKQIIISPSATLILNGTMGSLNLN